MAKFVAMFQFVAVFAIVLIAGVLISGSMFAQSSGKSAPSAPAKVVGAGTKTDDGLQYWDVRVGNGETAKEGSRVRVHYTGWLANGKKFDSSLDAGRPFDFTLGNHEVIKGWEEGITGMRANGKRQLRIPPELAYGADGDPEGGIPANATLIFDVQLLQVQ